MEMRAISQDEKVAREGCSKPVLETPMTTNNKPSSAFSSCSNSLSSDQRGGAHSGSLTTVSASCERLPSQHWAIVAKAIFSTPPGFTKPCELPAGCIHKQFRIMYVMCSTTLRTTETETSNQGNKTMLLLSKMQLILFWTVALLSILRSFSDAKYALLWFLFHGGLNWVIKLAYSVTSLLTTLCATWILWKKSKAVRTMLDCILQYEHNIYTKSKWCYLPTILAVGTALLALLQSVFVVELRDLSPEKVILLLSFQISEDIYLWSSNSLNVSSNLLETEYGTHVNFVTVALATVKIAQDFMFNMRQGLVWDLLLVATLTLQVWMNLFEERVQDVMLNVPHEFPEEAQKLNTRRVVVWNMYKDIRGVFEAVNDVLEPLIFLFHHTNILRYALFMERCICSQNATLIIFIQIIYDVVKSELIYMAASNMINQNKAVRKWLRNWSLSTGTSTEMDAGVVLDELTDEPLGFGQKDFVIHSGLHLKVLGLTGSLFLLLANKN